MSKEIYISSTPHETRLAIVENDELTEMYYERENEYTLAGSIYNGKVTRVLPGMQSSFVDVGLERDAFLYITDFMEEAGDSAEFDSGEGGDRRGRGRGEGRGRRDQPALTDGAEPVENGERAARVEGQSRTEGQERPERSDRGDRPDRQDRRGRGRSDRGDAARAGETQSPRQGTAVGAPLPTGTGAMAGDEATGEPGDTERDASGGTGEVGADGSRRWRGRRGRRRGRGTGSREGSSPVVPGTEDTAEAVPEEMIEERLELDAAAEDQAAEATLSGEDAAPIAGSRRPRMDGPSAYGDESRGARDRGGRGDRGDRGGWRDRQDRDARPGRGVEGREQPTGGARGGYGGVEETVEAAAGTPIVLPGESLAKYRPGSEPAARTGESAAPPTSVRVTNFVLPGAWTGGDVMPGETLRPRSGGSERQSGGEAGRPAFGRRPEGGDDRGGRRDRGGRGDRWPERNRQRSAPTSAEGSVPEFASHLAATGQPAPFAAPEREARERGRPAGAEHVAEWASLAEPAGVLDAGPAVAGPIHPGSEEDLGDKPGASAMAAGEQPATTMRDPGTTVAEPGSSPVPEELASAQDQPADPFGRRDQGEYEPIEGSASHRFDPAPPREYRQSAPVQELETEPDAGADRDRATAAEPEAIAAMSASTHLITPPAGAMLQPLVHETTDQQAGIEPQPAQNEARQGGEARSESAGELPGHEFTAISPAGEMLSEQVAPQSQEIADPAAPIRHESVVVDAEDAGPAEAAGITQRENFDGGIHAGATSADADTDGDSEPATLHASVIEEIDYDEEETLEGAADLGSMIREMSIDEITAPAGEADAHADFDDEDVAFDEQDASEGAEAYAAIDEVDEDGSDDLEETAGVDESEESRSFAATEPSTAEGAAAGDRGQGSERRRHGRRDGRRFERGGERREDRARNTGGSGDRSMGMRQGRHRHSAQTTNLPAISDLLKPGQELLVQIAKEPIAKKGARITSHIALPGRFLVFMPTVHHTGVSRKIESEGERRRLKEILLSEKGEASGGFIVRTAASGASEEELRSDLRFLLNLWADIKQRSETSKSPALIYHDLNLVERILRDQVTDTFSAIWVDTEGEYERVLRFLQRFQPSLIRRVKLYSKDTPLFEQFGLQEEINKALRSKVWLKSGGSIVINQTEALVAIDINTGKYVGKTARLEDTIVKTNLDAIPEIVRQIRLRDLGGIIIIDFIDMDERKNRHRVMAALEDELKKDRAPSKVLQFNDFGLVAITRKRVKQSLERTLSTTCGVCAGTGMVKSPVTVCNEIYVEMRKMQKHLDRGDVMLRVNPEVVKQLKSPSAKWLQEMEDMVGKTILVKSDPTLHPEQFDIH